MVFERSCRLHRIRFITLGNYKLILILSYTYNWKHNKNAFFLQPLSSFTALPLPPVISSDLFFWSCSDRPAIPVQTLMEKRQNLNKHKMSLSILGLLVRRNAILWVYDICDFALVIETVYRKAVFLTDSQTRRNGELSMNVEKRWPFPVIELPVNNCLAQNEKQLYYVAIPRCNYVLPLTLLWT